MEPTLHHGDYVVASNLRVLSRGQVVVYEHPHTAGYMLVKRVVGLPGETVSISDEVVMVDGSTFEQRTPGGGMWELGADEVFVLGDNRSHSGADSRQLGPIPIPGLMLVRMRYWPTIRWVGAPRAFFPQ